MNYITENDILKLKEYGYIIIKNFYNISDIIKMRKIILYNSFIKKNILFMGEKSGSKPDFLNDNDYKGLTQLLKLNEIHHIMKQIFKNPFHLCMHNDIGINRIVNWHKDTLNNQYKIYQQKNIWLEYNNESYEIYKFLIYLQDHHTDGLTLIEKSHLTPEIIIDEKNKKYLNNSTGDIIIFDQRITHKGQPRNNNKIDRILISLGFGKNNIFTKEFEEGTRKRQNDQNKQIIMRYRH
jgi:ectoine hydroxylase-related dioxygenase (phytanoyl-CoA dioxygenase family)